MDEQTIIFITFVGSVLAILAAFIWIAIRIGPKKHGNSGHNNEEIFNEEFREKLRQRGIARFEKTIDQNATFLQKDLHNIGEEISEYIKDRATDILKDEFADQKATVAAAQHHIIEVFANVEKSLSQYQQSMTKQFSEELEAEKKRRLQRFESNMAEIVIKHVEQTLSANMKIDEQVEYILKQLENNKSAILEDIKREF